MRFLLCALSLVVLFGCFVSALPFSAVPSYEGYTFERFVAEFNKQYSSDLSRSKHERIFYKNLQKIVGHNKAALKGEHSFYMKVNPYVDLEEETIKAKFTGRSKRIAALGKNKLGSQRQYQMKGLTDLPDSIDWRNSGAVTPVKDQGGCGSCWAHAAVESIESSLFLSSNKLLTLSPQHVLECTPNPNHCGGTGGCGGATAELAFEWAKNGVASLAAAPYLGRDASCPSNLTLSAKVGGYVKLPENNDTALLEAVATVGPISVSVDAGAWSFYGGGVFNGCNNANPDINHAVQLVGYGTDNGQAYWLVRNSWGLYWGENGYIRLYRGAAETCGTDTHPQDGSACDGETQPIKVCGTCGIWYDNSYPTEVQLWS